MSGSVGPPPPHLALLDSAPMGRRQYAIWLLASGGTLLDGFSIFSLGVAMPLLTTRLCAEPADGRPDRRGAGARRRVRRGRSAVRPPTASAASRRFSSTWRSSPLAPLISAVAERAAVDTARSVPGRRRHRHRFPGQRVLRVGDHAQARAQPHGGRDHRAAVGRACCSAPRSRSRCCGTRQRVRLAMDRRRDRRRRRRASPAATLASGKSALAARARHAEEARACRHRHAAGRIAGREHRRHSRPRLAVLFSRPYRTRTLLVSVPWFLMDIATYGVGLFTPLILGAIHLSATATAPAGGRFRRRQGHAPRSICSCWSASWSAYGRCRASVASTCRSSASPA